ncbi:NUDIX domain-containing protein [Parapedobacter tibetensis]|uniref:NUDIX domain-containing protein n=1 Tax=Parapedobacter tibetensis TaxID=2972951 RepID=UPI00214D5726|nr:NUDIX domain-containing protein [Parapedobacter tibetensis]
MNKFNIRVYGFLINERSQVLISDEREQGMEFTKFPGGGLEYGEGLLEGLGREFKEECGMEIEILRHIHTTDVFFKSAFNDSQVIGIYYLVRGGELRNCRLSAKPFDFEDNKALDQVFRWVAMDKLDEKDLTFEMDRRAWRAFMSEKRHGHNFLR